MELFFDAVCDIYERDNKKYKIQDHLVELQLLKIVPTLHNIFLRDIINITTSYFCNSQVIQ